MFANSKEVPLSITKMVDFRSISHLTPWCCRKTKRRMTRFKPYFSWCAAWDDTAGDNTGSDIGGGEAAAAAAAAAAVGATPSDAFDESFAAAASAVAVAAAAVASAYY